MFFLAPHRDDVARGRAREPLHRLDAASDRFDVALHRRDVALHGLDATRRWIDAASHRASVPPHRLDAAETRTDEGDLRVDAAWNRASSALLWFDVASDRADAASHRAASAWSRADVATHRADAPRRHDDSRPHRDDARRTWFAATPHRAFPPSTPVSSSLTHGTVRVPNFGRTILGSAYDFSGRPFVSPCRRGGYSMSRTRARFVSQKVRASVDFLRTRVISRTCTRRTAAAAPLRRPSHPVNRASPDFVRDFLRGPHRFLPTRPSPPRASGGSFTWRGGPFTSERLWVRVRA
jgi:hypothetical protein